MKIREYCPKCRVMFPNREREATTNQEKWRELWNECSFCEHSLEPVVLDEDDHIMPQNLNKVVGDTAKRLFDVLIDERWMPRLCSRDDLVFIDCTTCVSGSWKDWEVPYSFDTALRNGHDGFVVSSGTNAGVAFVMANHVLRKFHPKAVHVFMPEHVEERFRATLDELTIPDTACQIHAVGEYSLQTTRKAQSFAWAKNLPMLSGWAPWGRRWGLIELFKCVLAGFKEYRGKEPVAYFQGVAGALGVWAMTRTARFMEMPWTPFLCMPSNSAPFARQRPVNVPGVVGMQPFNPQVIGEESHEVGPNPVAPVLDSKGTNAEQDLWHYRGNYPCVCLHNEEILEAWRELRELFPDVGLEAGTAYAGYKKTVKEHPEMLKDKQVVINLSGRARPGDEELA